jgi:hypothetical protein
MWTLLIVVLAAQGVATGGVHSSVTTIKFQTQVACQNASKIVNNMTLHSNASNLTLTSNCVQGN